MAQTNYTPISLYYSATASNVPTAANLVPGELAINTADGKLYYEDSAGVVQVLATKSTGSIGGSNTQVQFNNSGSLGGSSSFTWDGTTVTATKFAGALNGTVGATTASTGAFTTLSTSSTTTFSGLTASTALALDASKNVVSVTNTGTGNNVLSASPTLTGTIAGASLSLSSLTSGRVTYATTSGLLTDSATLTYNGTTLTATTGANFCTTSGNVGIGTSSPSSFSSLARNLVVESSTSAGITISESTGAGSANLLFAATSGFPNLANITRDFASNSLQFGINQTERMRIDSSGNLGLGVTPSAWQSTFKALQVGSGTVLYNNSSSNGTFLGSNFYWNGSNNIYIATTTATAYGQVSGQHQWFQAASGTAGNAISFTQAMTLDASGNLLVGTTTGGAGLLVNTKFAVDGGSLDCAVLKATAGAGYAPLIAWNSATTGDNTFITFNTEGGTGTQRGTITYNRAGGLTVYNTTSDYRAKDITGSVTNSGEIIDSVPVYMGKMKGATQSRPMFIAHETPEYAHTGEKDAVDKDGKPVYQQMDASALVPVMWAEIQSLRQRIATLENK